MDEDEMFFIFRSYMEPATNVSPDDNELLYDQAIYFGPYLNLRQRASDIKVVRGLIPRTHSEGRDQLDQELISVPIDRVQIYPKISYHNNDHTSHIKI